MKQFEPNWRCKSLNSLEKVNSNQTTEEGYLIQTIHRLRSVPLNEFSIEDLRIMIGQGIGLIFLVPLAIEQLQDNLLAEGDYYEGDLLQSVLKVDKHYWRENQVNWSTVNQLIHKRLDELSEEKIAFEEFMQVF